RIPATPAAPKRTRHHRDEPSRRLVRVCYKTHSCNIMLVPAPAAPAAGREHPKERFIMKAYEPEDIRNLGVIGHGDAGKTSLVSALLYTAGAVNRLGKVDEGTTVTDFDEEEIARKITLSSATCFLEWNRKKINLLDTPGYANFIADAKAALRVVDGTLLAV